MKGPLIVSFIVGLLFSIGLALSGMTQPHVVIGFLNPFDWNPSLLFVMIGAIGVHGTAFFFLKKKKRPVLSLTWHMPLKTKLDKRLIIGSFIFGIGWGLGGYCPGPALASLPTLGTDVIGFVLAMTAGMQVSSFFQRRKSA